MGFSALWIFIFHEWIPVFSQIPVINSLEVFLKEIGFCGVDIFLLLSGFGLVFSIEKNALPRFYLNRLKRVYPAFFVVGVFSLIYPGWSFPVFLKNITGIAFYTINIYSFLWFVPAVITLYLIFPLYYRFFSRTTNKKRFLIVTFVLWLLLSLLCKDVLREDLYGFTNRIPIFCFGIACGWYYKTGKPLKLKSGFLVLLFFLGLVLAYITTYRGYQFLIPESNCSFPNMLMASSLPFLLARFFSTYKHAPTCSAFLRFFEFFGEMSLEFYCVQEALGIAVKPLFGSVFPLVVNFVVFVLSSLAGYALHKCLKKVIH